MRIKKLKVNSKKLTKAKARIIAHLIGDGSHYQSKHDYNIKYEVRDEESLKQFSNDLKEVYGLKPSWKYNFSGITGRPIKFVRLRSKLAFYDLLKYATYYSKNWRIKSPFLKSSLKIKKEFLRALFDDEGSVIKGRIIVVRLYSINKKGLLQVKKILKEFKVDAVLKSGFGHKRNVYALVIKDLYLFYYKLGFNLKRKQEKLNKLLDV